MPRGEKSKYTDKQERKADHIAEGYEENGVSEKEAEDSVEIARTTGGVRKVVKIFDYCKGGDEPCRAPLKQPSQ